MSEKRKADQIDKEGLALKLQSAKRHVRHIENLILKTSMCKHEVVVKQFPSGLRDNGEVFEQCQQCGKLM